MNKKIILLLTISLILILSLCIISYQKIQQISFSENYYNVKKFGAKGDNKTDDTKAIQAAINAAVSHGGGVVYFPAGIYNIAGPIIDSVGNQSCFSQLYIPYSDIEHPKTITFKGESAPEFETQGLIKVKPSLNGVILSSAIVSNDSTHAVIGVVKGPGDSWSQWNYITPYFKDMGIRTCTMRDTIPITNSLCGINLRYASKCHFDNILIDTQSPLSISLDPSQTGSIGLITPEVNNHAMVSIGLIRIGGYAYGIKFSEHFVAQDVQVICCNVGIFSEYSHHSSSIQTLEVECCPYPVVLNPGHNLYIANYNVEHFVDDKWFCFVQDITFKGTSYYPAKVVIGLCHPVVSNIGYDVNNFKTNNQDRVVLLENSHKIEILD